MLLLEHALGLQLDNSLGTDLRAASRIECEERGMFRPSRASESSRSGRISLMYGSLENSSADIIDSLACFLT